MTYYLIFQEKQLRLIPVPPELEDAFVSDTHKGYWLQVIARWMS